MQTDFKTYSTPMIIGQVADSSLNQIDSFAAEADIEFGTAVQRGTNKETQVLPSDGKEFLGIALRNDLCVNGLYKSNSMVSILTKGRVVVKVAEAVVAGDTAYLQADGTFNKTEGEEGSEGLVVGIFASTQESENNLAILEIK